MSTLFDGCGLKTAEHKLPNKKIIILRELTARERGKLREIAEGDLVAGQAKIVILGCDVLSDGDLDQLQDLPGSLLSKMADVILNLSGLGEDAKDEAKNA